MEHIKKNGCGLLALHTGFGKTCIGLYILSLLKKKTLIIVHKEFLLRQWIERIEQFLPDARVGKIQAKTIDVEDKDIVIFINPPRSGLYKSVIDKLNSLK